ncbi:MAG: DUF4160 domain-containing protein [Chloroflexi bacterium]|nr:DUF4160 domain-containing protein [Chloroflexota bacterium]
MSSAIPASEKRLKMSPTVLRKGKLKIMVFSRDHNPPHVHVYDAEKQVTIKLKPVQVMENSGFNSRKLGQVLEIIEEHQALLLAAWEELNGQEE